MPVSSRITRRSSISRSAPPSMVIGGPVLSRSLTRGNGSRPDGARGARCARALDGCRLGRPGAHGERPVQARSHPETRPIRAPPR
jgi:hypothetical protein